MPSGRHDQIALPPERDHLGYLFGRMLEIAVDRDHRLAAGVREAGAERVIFSSDIPFIDLRYCLGRVLFAGLNPAEQALVLGGNIRRLLKLEGAPGAQPKSASV